MKPNITMIGMPSSGKSTIGVLLAKRLGFSFVDVDIVIQEKEGRLLKEIIAQEGMDGFLKVEERINAGLDVTLSVIAPGGSVIYGEKAMEHLKEISEVVYLKMSYEEMENRIGNVDITIDEEGKTPGETVDALRDIIEGMMDRSMIERIVEEQKKILEEKDRKIEAYEAEIAALKEELALFRAAETGGCGN